MQIKCPICGGCCESDVTPIVGQHLLCPFCESKFSFGTAPRKPSKSKSCTSSPKRLAHGNKKFCSNCGAEISVKAVICPRCGAQTGAQQFLNNEDVQNHLTLAIVILVLCFPVGLAALIFALMVNAQMSKGNVIAARNYSRTAGILVKIGIALVIFEVAVAFVCVLLVGVSVVSTGSYIRQVEMESQREVEKVEREFNDMMDRIQYSNYD